MIELIIQRLRTETQRYIILANIGIKTRIDSIDNSSLEISSNCAFDLIV